MSRSTDPHLVQALRDRYVIEREVGAGGMATVFLARDIKHDRHVALKVLRPELSSVMAAERFPREIRLVAQFNHPHILSLYDSGEAGAFLYYVMPYVDGESLRDRLAREHRLSIAESIRILRDVADALAYAHARGVVHRDIKPANILLSGRHAVVTDFGIAKALTAAAGDTLTTIGITVGTPHYMAPEQAVGDETVGPRADLYALGVVGYEMLAGRAPFEGTPQAVLAAHVLTAPPELRTARPDVPAALSDIIMRCLAKDPAERWSSADEVVARLEALASSASVGVTPRAKSRWMLAGGAVGIGVLAAGLWSLLHFAATDRADKIGVMPIEDISGKDSMFVSAMQDALTNSLARINIARVAPRSAMMRYKGSPKTTRDIANDLQLGGLVEATVFRAGTVMRINVQLTNPVTSSASWSDTYERDVSNVLDAQSDVVARITAGIQGALSNSRKRGGGT